jgi:starch-binding outer membrane protein, SusD/RagB family
MKALIIIVSICMIYALTTSCEKMMGSFLDKPPGVDVTEDTIFSNKVQVETFVASIYQYGVHSHMAYGTASNSGYANRDRGMFCSSSNEAEACGQWYSSQKWNAGTISADNTNDTRWSYRWIAIRKVSVLLDRIDGAEGTDLDANYKNQVKGEARFIRALNYFEMFKRYGGVAIIKNRIQLTDTFTIPRSTLQEVLDFILEDCDAAVALLPDSYTTNFKGRATKGAVLALKAKTLLYAASPRFNTATPYLDAGVNNNLICFGNTDVSRWQKAADAAKAVIDWAPSGSVALITDKGVTANYRYQWEQYDNAEIIFAEKSVGQFGTWTAPWGDMSPVGVYNASSGQTGTTVTLNFVRKYEKADGTPAVWDLVNGGFDLQAKMASLDPRFAQTIAYNMSFWNSQNPQIQIWQASTGFAVGKNTSTCSGGFWLHKFYPAAINSLTTWQWAPECTLFQLNEDYLIYAEALNEALGGPNAEAYAAVNAIRARSGMPPLPAGLSQADFRTRIRNEWDVELSFEDTHFFNVMRWLIAETDGEMQGGMYGIKIYGITGSSEFQYVPYIFETRTWVRRMYLMPFPTGEIKKGYIIQNPGY